MEKSASWQCLCRSALSPASSTLHCPPCALWVFPRACFSPGSSWEAASTPRHRRSLLPLQRWDGAWHTGGGGAHACLLPILGKERGAWGNQLGVGVDVGRGLHLFTRLLGSSGKRGSGDAAGGEQLRTESQRWDGGRDLGGTSVPDTCKLAPGSWGLVLSVASWGHESQPRRSGPTVPRPTARAAGRSRSGS